MSGGFYKYCVIHANGSDHYYHLKHVGGLENSCSKTARLMKNVKFNLSSNVCAFHCLSPVIIIHFAFVMNYDCLFIRGILPC